MSSPLADPSIILAYRHHLKIKERFQSAAVNKYIANADFVCTVPYNAIHAKYNQSILHRIYDLINTL